MAVRFRPDERIRRRAEFKQVYDRGARTHSRYGTLFVLANKRAAGRLGIAATKKLGGAVQRNRAKRLIREVFRRNKIAPGFDVVVIPKRDLLDFSEPRRPASSSPQFRAGPRDGRSEVRTACCTGCGRERPDRRPA